MSVSEGANLIVLALDQPHPIRAVSNELFGPKLDTVLVAPGAVLRNKIAQQKLINDQLTIQQASAPKTDNSHWPR